MNTDNIQDELEQLNKSSEEILNTLGERFLGDNILDLLTKLLEQSKKQTELLEDIESRLRNIESNTDGI